MRYADRDAMRVDYVCACLRTKGVEPAVVATVREVLHPALALPRGYFVSLRDEAIRREFRGDNHRELAIRYGVSARQIRRILAATGDGGASR